MSDYLGLIIVVSYLLFSYLLVGIGLIFLEKIDTKESAKASALIFMLSPAMLPIVALLRLHLVITICFMNLRKGK